MYEAIVEDLLREPASAGTTYWHMATRRDAGVSITMSQHVVPSEGGLAAKSLDDPPRSRGQKPPRGFWGEDRAPPVRLAGRSALA